MTYPSNLRYTKDHEWISSNDQKTGVIGVTAYAIEQLGDIVHLDLPKVGAELKANDPFGTIESTKTVSDLYAPVSGTVTAVNTELASNFDLFSSDPHGKAWLLKVDLAVPKELESLLTANQYEQHIQ